MSRLPIRQGEYARRAGGPPPGGLAAVRAGAQRRRRRALVLGTVGCVVGGALAALLLVPGGPAQHRALLVVAPRSSSAPPSATASPTPSSAAVTTSARPSLSTLPPTRAAGSPSAGSTAPTVPTTPVASVPEHQQEDVRPALTGPTHAVVGQPVTFTLTVDWSAERPADQFVCWQVPGGNWVCPVDAPCQQEGFRPAQPGQDTVQATRTFDAAGTYAVMGYAGTTCGQYWQGENASYLAVTVTAAGTTPAPSATGTASASPG